MSAVSSSSGTGRFNSGAARANGATDGRDNLRRSLAIKVSAVKRLKNDQRSYQRELEGFQTKLNGYLQRSHTAQTTAPATVTSEHQNELDELTISIRKQREFIDECRATIHDLSLKLEEAVQNLRAYMVRSYKETTVFVEKFLM